MDELQVEMKSLFVRLGNNVSTTQRIDLINGLRAYIDPTFHTLQVWAGPCRAPQGSRAGSPPGPQGF